jgi:hypothetical protein
VKSNEPKFLPVGKDYYDPQDLVNHEHIRNALIRAYWDGLSHSEIPYSLKLEIISGNFFIGESLIKRIISNNEYRKVVTK